MVGWGRGETGGESGAEGRVLKHEWRSASGAYTLRPCVQKGSRMGRAKCLRLPTRWRNTEQISLGEK